MKKIERAPSLQEIASEAIKLAPLYLTTKRSSLLNLVRRINDEYLYWDKVKQKIPGKYQNGLTPEALWYYVKAARNHDKKTIAFLGFTFQYTVGLDKIQASLQELDSMSSSHSPSKGDPSESDQRHPLMNLFFEESIASSRLEGTITSRLAATSILLQNRHPCTTSERKIANNYRTIQHILRIKQQPLTPETLLEIHQLITANPLGNGSKTGQLRTYDDVPVMHAVDRDVIHIPHQTLPTFINVLCRLFNEEDKPTFLMHPIVRASIIHFLVDYFHPFAKGNSRTAQALVYWYLLRRGYWLMEHISVSKAIEQSRTQYYRALYYAKVDENDMTYFILYYIKALTQAYEESENNSTQEMDEEQQVVSLQKVRDVSSRRAEIINLFRENTNAGFTAKEIGTRFGIASGTARIDLHHLVALGFLNKRSSTRGKEKLFVKSPRFDQVQKRR